MAEQPIYRRIADRLREQIDSGELVPGQKLPTETELRKEHDASRNTIRDAIKWLTSLGLVETRPGQGTFVVKKIDPFITTLSADTGTGLGGGEGATYLSQVSEQDREASSTDPQVEMQKAAGEVAARLQLEEGAQVISRHQKRYIDGTPWSLQTSFYPRGLAQNADRLLEPADIAEGTVRYLAETLGLRQVGYRDWITVRTPNDHEAEFFRLPEDGRVGVFEVFRAAYDQTGTPMRLTVTIFPTDRNQFVVNDGQVPPIAPRRDASTKKSLANPLQAGQTASHLSLGG
jgi:GntR family transcriptional regulator